MVRRVMWRRLDGSGGEVCELVDRTGAPGLRGLVAEVVDGGCRLTSYAVHCAAGWRTRHVDVEVIEPDGRRRAVTVEHAPRSGLWRVNRAVRPDLSGCRDIDLGITPATNTLPLRRLDLASGESRSTTAVWVRFPELTIRPLHQTYHNEGAGSVRYESRGGAFTAVLEVDDAGMVTRYGDRWERVGPALNRTRFRGLPSTRPGPKDGAWAQTVPTRSASSAQP